MLDAKEAADRARAAQLFEAGWGYKAVASELGIRRETMRDWSYSWRAIGTESFCSQERSRAFYPKETKRSAVMDRLNGVSVADVMERYGIPNRCVIKRWMSEYRRLGESAFERDEGER